MVKKIRVENRKFLGEISKKGHREFGVPGNLFYKKALNKSVFENYPLPNLSRQPAGFLLSRRRPQICGLAEFKPKFLLSRPEIYSKPAWGSICHPMSASCLASPSQIKANPCAIVRSLRAGSHNFILPLKEQQEFYIEGVKPCRRGKLSVKTAGKSHYDGFGRGFLKQMHIREVCYRLFSHDSA